MFYWKRFIFIVFFRKGTALKILFSNGVVQLQRSEIVALINAFTRLSTSIYHLGNTFKEVINWKIGAL